MNFSKEQQLAEMIEIIKPFVSGLACEEESGSCELTDCRSCNARCLANAILKKDYGKQLKGKWIAKETMIRTPSARNYACSICGYASNETTHFCPCCGAKMILPIKLHTDKSVDWEPIESPLHTGKHSQ